MTVGELLDAIAERTPAPGGGTAAAMAGAVAAALLEMAARFGTPDPHVIERVGRLRARLLELAEIELHAYEPVLAALRLPREDPQRSKRLVAAQSQAAEPPFEIAVATAELAALGAQLVRTGNPNLKGDALTACALAEAACSAAARLVEINLADEEGEADPRVGEARECSRQALAARGG